MHKVQYRNCNCSWEEALPIGNGHFGAMAYGGTERLTFAINHYDIYYQTLAMYGPQYQTELGEERPTDTSRYETISRRGLERHDDPLSSHLHYHYTLYPEAKSDYGVQRPGITHPSTAELIMIYDQQPDRHSNASEMSLNIEEARFRHTVGEHEDQLQVSAIMSPHDDIMIMEMKRQGSPRIKALEVTVPQCRYLKRNTRYARYDQHTFYLTDTFYPHPEESDGEPFSYIFMIRISGIRAEETIMADHKMVLTLSDDEDEADFHFIAAVVTEEETEQLLETALMKVERAESGLQSIIRDHQQYWAHFWSKSSISLPDPILEHIWYLHLYTLDCSSGRGARLYEQGCGLNGLWDIKQPSQWGSSWYWDVNIQQSYWPIYTSNHLEVGDAFYRGLLSYVEAARKRAKEKYGFRGIATDYPFEFYNAIWPWCAQFFWWHYRYSGDTEFLKSTAYPLFQEILLFYEDYLKYDSERDCYIIYPDISPEQGPVSQNSTISLACLKYLLESAIAANNIVGGDEDERKRWETIWKKLPDYPIGETLEFGQTLKDSEWAAPNEFLAHPSVFMPIYPLGYISKRSDENYIAIGKNTLDYVDNRQAHGTFNFAWEACTAARLGMGAEAVRRMYEKGIAFMMRANGMFAEETDRWIQNCLTASDPVYSPPMMEAGGSAVAAINEMLLQSFQGVIEVFPAIPRESRVQSGKAYRYNAIDDTDFQIDPWDNCAFDRLLAEGAFEVSARLESGHTQFVQIRSLAGNTVRLIHPFTSSKVIVLCEDQTVPFIVNENRIEFQTQRGKVYRIVPAGKTSHDEAAFLNHQTGPFIYQAPSKRRVFLGKDEHTEFFRQLDHATFDYYQGDKRVSRVSVYRMDFGIPQTALHKEYQTVLPRQFHHCGKQGLEFKRISENTLFLPYTGYGWIDSSGLQSMDRALPDSFRRDFVCGTERSRFMMQLAKGHYQLLLVTGDEEGHTSTAIDLNGRQEWNPSAALAPGTYATIVVPFIQPEDGNMTIDFCTVKGHKWNVNMLIVNRLL